MWYAILKFWQNNGFLFLMRALIRIYIQKYHYAKIIKRLRKSQKNYPDYKIRICFLVNESAKWSVQFLYDELEKHPHFYPCILITLADIQRTLPEAEQDKELQKNYDFFHNQGMHTEYAFDMKTRSYIALKYFSPDIVVYQQPWGIHPGQDIQVTMSTALTIYFPYGIQCLENPDNYLRCWHFLLWRYFVDLKFNIERFRKMHILYLWNCIYIGYPKLDAYHNCPCKKNNKRKTVIYAPHWSFGEYSSFPWSYKKILELAQKYPDIDWIFKPHPTFRYALEQSQNMNRKEIDAYFSFWEKRGKVLSTGNYFQIFKDSDLMITDSISFLGEYLLSGHPLIYMRNHDVPLAFNSTGEKIISHYYSVSDEKALDFYFSRIMVKNEDPMRKKREKYAHCFSCNLPVSPKIISYLDELLYIK